MTKASAIPLKVSLGALAALAVACVQTDPLRDGFSKPPQAASPQVWWHWLDGNIDADAAQRDLEWMTRVGVGGVQIVDAALGGPQVVPERVTRLSPTWEETLERSVSFGAANGMDVSIGASPGWSLTGGPWVEPQHAMKKLVWSETIVEGGRPFTGALAAPPENAGPFQDLPSLSPAPAFYRDAAVLAFRRPATDAGLRPSVSASNGSIDGETLRDGVLAQAIELPADEQNQGWIEFTFDEPTTVQALRYVIGRTPGFGPFPATGPSGELSAASADGVFAPVATLSRQGAAQQTVAFEPVTATRFRLTLTAEASGAPSLSGANNQSSPHFEIAELVLLAGAQINRWEDKAGFSHEAGLAMAANPANAIAAAVDPASVIDLTSKLAVNGRLDWTPPAGEWVVLRLGYSLTGAHNDPAPPDATGLEVDKLNRDYVGTYLDSYLSDYERILGPDLMGARGLKHLNVDSWESGSQNWTDDMVAQFRDRRGYDPTPWLPVLTGRVIGDVSSSERFLWDFRITLGDLVVDEHYREIARAAHDRGMTSHVESHEMGRAFIGDGLSAKKFADAPMGAMWTDAGSPAGRFAREMDIRESASAAHIWGKRIVAAEAFTALDNPYGFSPASLKKTADRLFALGVNRIFVHTSVHQPNDDSGPGLGLGPFGQWFTRKETWAELAGPWLTYLARSSYLLQQGDPVADIAYFYGADDNITALFASTRPELPEGYSFDFVNADVVSGLSVADDGQLTTPDGMHYRALVLGDGAQRMTMDTLASLRDLVSAGAIVIGPRPDQSPSLADDPIRFQKLVDEMWGGNSGAARRIAVGDVGPALLGVAPDVRMVSRDETLQWFFAHRKTDSEHIYFLAVDRPRGGAVDFAFRVTDRTPELWNPDTGEIVLPPYRAEQDETIVTIDTGADEAVFVVFRDKPSRNAKPRPAPQLVDLLELSGPWTLQLPEQHGGPGVIDLDRLVSWTDLEPASAKYFSGIGTYDYQFEAPADWFGDGARILIDLGEVHEIARVSVNGQTAAGGWKRPFQFDITDMLTSGSNHVTISVANLWGNRLIGDRQPGAASPPVAASYNPFSPDATLRRSGLLGPVRILSSK